VLNLVLDGVGISFILASPLNALQISGFKNSPTHEPVVILVGMISNVL